MIDPTQNASAQIQQSVTNPFQKRNEGQQQQQVRSNEQQTQNTPVKKTTEVSASNASQKSEPATLKSAENDASRSASRTPRGSLLDITV